MKQAIVQSRKGVTIAGGGPFSARLLSRALLRAPCLVAADGGADRLLSLGEEPAAVIGDMDSISPAARQRLAGRLHEIGEQTTTDFDKVLQSVEAPFALALGFAGGRMDHGLAVMHGLVRQGGFPVLVLGPKDLAFHAPPGREMALHLQPGDPLSLFPLDGVTGESTGLEWPVKGLDFHPARVIGTSNRVTAPEVRLRFDGPGMLVILPLARLDAAISGLVPRYLRPRRRPPAPTSVHDR
ncbi:MAG: thiamine diphosphokinase [Paracoccaceae bacterium]